MLFGRFAARDKVISVGTTAQVILQNNPERIGFVMVNTGGVQITFGLNRDIVDSKGFVLPAQGDTVSSTYTEDADFPAQEISAIGATPAGELFITEFIRVGV